MQPKRYILDNEVSTELKTKMKKYGIEFQLVPPHIHRRNAAERAIHSCKHHFKATLASCDTNFTLAEWDRLLHQTTELTLNLLRNAQASPKLSAYAYIFGQFDLNATPLAPHGTCNLVQSKVGNSMLRMVGMWDHPLSIIDV